MASSARRIVVEFLGDAKQLDRTASHVDKTTSGIGSKMSKVGKVAAAGFLVAGTAAVAFAKKSVNAYEDAAKESMLLARQTGLTVKAASQLRFAGEESGVQFDKLSTGMKIFSKNLGTSAADSKKAAVMTSWLGTNFEDAHGQILPMAELLPKVADQFKRMPDGPVKTAMAMKLFGKGGADMIKVLNKGSDGLKELAKESDKTGNTISNTDSYKKNVQAQREFHAAIRGLMVTVGGMLMPIITKLSLYMTEHVAPAFESVSGFVKHHKDLVAALAPVIVGLVTAFAGFKILKSITTGFAALNAVMALNPIGLVIVAIAALVAGLIYAYKHSETFRNIVNGAFTAVKKVAGGVLSWLTAAVKNTIDFVRNHWKLILSILTGPIGAATIFIVSHFGKIKTAGTNVVNWIKDIPGKLKALGKDFKDAGAHLIGKFVDGMKNAAGIIGGIAGNVWSTVKRLLNKAIDKINTALEFKISLPGPDISINPPNIPHLAKGGIVRARPGGTLALLGEAGRDEMVVPLGGPSSRRSADGGFLGTVAVDLRLDGRTIQTVLLKLKRERGGHALGIA